MSIIQKSLTVAHEIGMMARILGLDYGTKRCGLSVTDPLQIIVTALDTVATQELEEFIVNYCNVEEVEKLVIGQPKHKDGKSTYLQEYIDVFVKNVAAKLPGLIVDFADESFTSVMAKEIILKIGYNKTKRRDKELVDRVSAVLILQQYLGHI